MKGRTIEPTLDHKIETVERVRDEAMRQGVSVGWAGVHIVVSFDPPPTFQLGGTSRQYGGAANLQSGNMFGRVQKPVTSK